MRSLRSESKEAHSAARRMLPSSWGEPEEEAIERVEVGCATALLFGWNTKKDGRPMPTVFYFFQRPVAVRFRFSSRMMRCWRL